MLQNFSHVNDVPIALPQNLPCNRKFPAIIEFASNRSQRSIPAGISSWNRGHQKIRPMRTRWYRYTKMEERLSRSSLHLEAVEAVRQRKRRRVASRQRSERRTKRGGLTGVQSTRMLCMQMRSDRPIGYPVHHRPPHGSSSSLSPPRHPTPGSLSSTDSPRPGPG